MTARLTFDEASSLADLWHPALAASWRLGYGHGYETGYAAADADMAAAWHSMWLRVRATLDQPTRGELAVRRDQLDEPCEVHCDRCSRCVRHAAALGNLRLYGTPYYPGTLAAVIA